MPESDICPSKTHSPPTTGNEVSDSLMRERKRQGWRQKEQEGKSRKNKIVNSKSSINLKSAWYNLATWPNYR